MRFQKRLPNDTATLLLLSVFLISILGLSDQVGDKASEHQVAISVVGAICLLIVYGAWLVALPPRRQARATQQPAEHAHNVLPVHVGDRPARRRRGLGGARLGLVRRRDRPGGREARHLEGVHGARDRRDRGERGRERRRDPARAEGAVRARAVGRQELGRRRSRASSSPRSCWSRCSSPSS